MYCVNTFRTNALKLTRASAPISVKTHQRLFSDEEFYRNQISHYPKDDRPCFDLRNLRFQIAGTEHIRMIKSFLYSHYWTREPTVSALWMDLFSPYLSVLSDKYSTSGYRTLALEKLERTGEMKLIGLSVANNIKPWMIRELEDWAHTTCPPDSSRMYFFAHCLRCSDLFKKYDVSSIYSIDVICTATEVCGHGVATQVVKQSLDMASELRFPLVQVISVNHYVSRICSKLGMTEDWSMDFDDFVDFNGKRVFYSRTPHTKVSIFTKYFNPKRGQETTCRPDV